MIEGLRETMIGKLHLLTPDGFKTVCGNKLSMGSYSYAVTLPWEGPAKCHRCKDALDRGSLFEQHEDKEDEHAGASS